MAGISGLGRSAPFPERQRDTPEVAQIQKAGQSPGQADPHLGSGFRTARWAMCNVFPRLPSGTDLRFAAETELAFLNFSSQTKIPVARLCATRPGSGL